MFLSEEQFIKIIGGTFWKHITTNLNVQILASPIKKKEIFLSQLYHKLKTKKYIPTLPVEYLQVRKSNNVLRMVPVFTLEDYCVYFYCLKVIESEIVENHQNESLKNVFGGFRIGGGFNIKKAENKDIKRIFDEFETSHVDYIPENAFNKFEWFENWKEFTKIVYFKSNTKQYDTVLEFDIANFYDSIRLDVLKDKLMSVCPSKYLNEIEILFVFLTSWNKIFENYKPKTVGLPQDIVSECSRLLANFYLRDFDKNFYQICSELNCERVRYSDDHVVFGSITELEKIIYVASKELHKIGLNINANKVQIHKNPKEFANKWGFEIFENINRSRNALRNNDIESTKAFLKTSVDLFYSKFNSFDDSYFRRPDSIIKAILNIGLNYLPNHLRHKVLSDIHQSNFLLNVDYNTLKNVIVNLNSSERKGLIYDLNTLSKSCYFNNFLYILLRIKKEVGVDEIKTKYLKKRVNELSIFNSPY